MLLSKMPKSRRRRRETKLPPRPRSKRKKRLRRRPRVSKSAKPRLLLPMPKRRKLHPQRSQIRMQLMRPRKPPSKPRKLPRKTKRRLTRGSRPKLQMLPSLLLRLPLSDNEALKLGESADRANSESNGQHKVNSSPQRQKYQKPSNDL